MKCKWCETDIREGSECDGCWEMRHRVEMDLMLAEKMVKALKEEKRVAMKALEGK